MTLLEMSFYGAVLILAVTVIRALGIQKLPKRTFLVLWGIVLLRLLLPLQISSTFSIYTAAGQLGGAGITDRAIQPGAAVTVEEASISESAKTGAGNPDEASRTDGMLPVNQSKDNEALNVSFSVQSVGNWLNSRGKIIWGIGVAVCFLIIFIPHLKSRKKYAMSLPLNDEEKSVLSEQGGWKDSEFRRVRVRTSDQIEIPMTYGVLRPVILIPKKFDWSNRVRTGYILAHEMSHVRHLDALFKYVLAAVVCVHWFNPFVWILYVLANRDIELACDESVLQRMGYKKRASYARTLIEMEEGKNRPGLLYSCFSRNSAEERIYAIMKMKKSSKIVTASAVVLVAGVTVFFATSAKAEVGAGEAAHTIKDYTLEENAAGHTAEESVLEESDVEHATTIVPEAQGKAEYAADSSEKDGKQILLQETAVTMAETVEEVNLQGEKERKELEKKTISELRTYIQEQMTQLEKDEKNLIGFFSENDNYLSNEYQDKWNEAYSRLFADYDKASAGLRVFANKLSEEKLDEKIYEENNDWYYEAASECGKRLDKAGKLSAQFEDKTDAQRRKDYQKRGITYKDDRAYYNGKLAGYIQDGYSMGSGVFRGMMSNWPDGEIFIKISRNENGKIIEVKTGDIKEIQSIQQIEESRETYVTKTEYLNEIQNNGQTKQNREYVEVKTGEIDDQQNIKLVEEK